MKLFPTIAQAWNAFVKKKKLLPIVVLIDILFVYALTRLHYEVFNRASMTAMKLTAMLSQQAQDLTESGLGQQLAVLQSPEFVTAYHELVKYISVFFGAAFLVWLVGKGLTWYGAHKTVERNVPAARFALKFLGMSVFWFAAFVVITIIALNLLEYALFGVFPLIGKASSSILVVLLYWVLAYFMCISYALVPHKTFRQTFKLGIVRWKELLPVHIIGSLIFFVATTVPASLVRMNVYLSFAFIIFFALPALAWARVFWSIAVHEVMKHA